MGKLTIDFDGPDGSPHWLSKQGISPDQKDKLRAKIREKNARPEVRAQIKQKIRAAQALRVAFDPDQERDESGKWTDGGGGSAGTSPHAEKPRVFKKSSDIGELKASWPGDPVRHGWRDKETGEVTGHLVTGKPLTREELPKQLLHVTTNAPAVESSGVLLGQHSDAGLGGGTDDGVSFTTSREDAQVIERELKRSVQIARGDVAIEDFERFARDDEREAGLLPGTLDGAVRSARRGYDASAARLDKTYINDESLPEEQRGWVGPPPSAAERERIRRSLVKDVFNAYLWSREDAAKTPLLKNPVLFGAQESLAKVTPDSVKILDVPSEHIPEEALVTTGSDDFLHEVRAYSDVPMRKRLRAAARKAAPETALHKTADSFQKKFEVAIRYAFLKGRQAARRGPAAVEKAIHDALLDVLPKTLHEAVIAGGVTGAEMLVKRRRAGLRSATFDPDQERDSEGQWTDGGGDGGDGGSDDSDSGSTKTWSNRAPKTAAEMSGKTPNAPLKMVKAYHVTKKENVEAILRDGFDLRKVTPRWQNDYAVSLSRGEKAARDYFSKRDPKTRKPLEMSDKYVLLEVKMRGRLVPHESFGQSPVTYSHDARDFTKKLIEQGYDGQDIGGTIFVNNPKAITSIRVVPSKKIKALMMRAAFDPSQERDEDGKWSGSGGGGSSSGSDDLVGDGVEDGDVADVQIDHAHKRFSQATLTETKRSGLHDRDKVYKGRVGGLQVRTEIPNEDSIEATFSDSNEYTRLKGIREVDISQYPKATYKSADDEARVDRLAAAIKESGEINPLIMIDDYESRSTEPGPYVLEGGHRFNALQKLGITKIPAVVIVDHRPKTGLRAAAKKKKPITTELKMRFDPKNPRAQEWAREHGAELAVNISETTRQRIATAIEELYESGEDPYDAILAAVGDDRRAELIARTEMMFAAHEGQRLAWDQAVEDGLLTGDEKRVWIVTPDDKLCPECEALDGVKVGLDEDYAEGVSSPPLHPACRCTEGLTT